MRLTSHLIIGGVAAAAIAPFWGIPNSLLFWFSAVMIDTDHYLDFLYRTKGKDWRPARMFRYYDEMTKHQKEEPNFLAFSLFHTIEIFLLIYLCALYINFNFFMVVLSGMFFHMILDMSKLKYEGVFFIRAYSIIEYKIRKSRLIQNGLNPSVFYAKIFKLSEKGHK